jgi:hypothetical protein
VKKAFFKASFTFLLFLVFSACAQKRNLMVKVTYMQPYCGGARPTPEMEADATKEKKYSNRMVIIVNTMGKADSCMTDSSGFVIKKMPFGNYKLYETWQYYKRGPNGESMSELDQECMKKEWEKPFSTVTFSKRMTGVSSQGPIVIQCPYNFPCTINKQPIPARKQ